MYAATGCGFFRLIKFVFNPLEKRPFVAFCCGLARPLKSPFFWGLEVAKSEQWQWIPTKLSCEQFEQFVLPHLSMGSRGPAPKLSLHTIFNYIWQLLYMGCQWNELPIEKDQEG